MRGILVFLLLLSSAFAVSFGRSVLEVERTWEITSDGPYNFTGALVVNDSYQHVVSVETEPEARIFSEGENVYISYNGSGSGLLRAKALVLVEYDPRIGSDAPLPDAPLTGEGLIAADDGIEAKARELSSSGSSLYTIRNLVNWVHGNIAYDLDYSGRVSPAIEVFRDRRGVCVEYSHLLISMLRSLGYQTRYVNGYVLDDSWQPHAWAEAKVPGYGWLALDPTLGQAGALDNTHIAIQNERDHSQAYDLLVSDSKGAALAVTDSISARSISEDPEGASITIDMDGDTLALEVEIANSRPDFVFGVYSFSSPRGYSGDSSSVVLLKPYERLRKYHGLNNSLFRDDFIYDIQVSASFNDVSEGRVFSVDRRREAPAPQVPEYYSIPVIIALLIALSVLTRRG